ncbi:uncharacterized protein BP5553_02663 [Venustampulla echinocandica]|uniref:Uncharacterized protein n=1 Tax=Venustampulla echinocandica TaxID=2656787 RepID=A0A370TS45_9HELO|nr:uncharacterized protein BP5553_02663 [Venustampulla echinocandica]RDL38323.1 hypothetical protein BP5553_02663 [Venustampulla echinocandica]
MAYRTVSTVYSCGHTFLRKETTPVGTFFGIAKRLFNSSPMVHEASEQVCHACENDSAKLSVSRPARHAPPALGHEETISVIALGGASFAVEKLKKVQQNIVAQQKQSLKQTQFMGEQIAKQMQAQGDLDGAFKFWEEFHQGHADGAISTNRNCARCSEMGEILTNPEYRAKTPCNDKSLGSNARSSEIYQTGGSTSRQNCAVDVCAETIQKGMERDHSEDRIKGRSQDESATGPDELKSSHQAEESQRPEYSQDAYAEIPTSQDGYTIPSPYPLWVGNDLLSCMQLSQSEPQVEDIFPDNEAWVQDSSGSWNISPVRSHKEAKRQPLTEEIPRTKSRFFNPACKSQDTVSPFSSVGANILERLREYFCLPVDFQTTDMKRFFDKRPLIVEDASDYLRSPPEWGIENYWLKGSTPWLDLRDMMIIASTHINWPVNMEEKGPINMEENGYSPSTSSGSYISESDDEDDTRLAAVLVHVQTWKGHREAYRDSFMVQERATGDELANVAYCSPIIPASPSFVDTTRSYLVSVKTMPSIAEQRIGYRPRKSSCLRTELIVL